MRRILKKIRHYYSVLGFRGVRAFLFAKLSGTKPLFQVNLAGIKYPIYVRIGTTDLSVLKQTLIEKHYDFHLPAKPKVIIDAGANIGLSAVFFANKYPDALVFAIEPEDSNFALLQKNVAPYDLIKPLKAALWWENRQVFVSDPGHGAHGFQTRREKNKDCFNEICIQGITVDALIKKMELQKVDVLKMDIEGSEKEVLENSSGWIANIQVIMAELHDHHKPGCQQAFFKATNGFGETVSKGETLMRVRARTSETVNTDKF